MQLGRKSYDHAGELSQHDDEEAQPPTARELITDLREEFANGISLAAIGVNL
jgi:hypothetical protein